MIFWIRIDFPKYMNKYIFKKKAITLRASNKIMKILISYDTSNENFNNFRKFMPMKLEKM